MNSGIDLDAAAEAVRTREDFAAFVRLLVSDLSSSSAEWENDTLPRFLEALAAWSNDMAGAYKNQGKPLPDPPTWNMFAEIFNAARIYE
jgi:hypothetical protein